MKNDLETITIALDGVTGGAPQAKLLKTTQGGRTVWVLPKNEIRAMNAIGPLDPRW